MKYDLWCRLWQLTQKSRGLQKMWFTRVKVLLGSHSNLPLQPGIWLRGGVLDPWHKTEPNQNIYHEVK